MLATASCRAASASIRKKADEYREDRSAPNGGMRVLRPEGDYEDRFNDAVTRRIQAAGVRLGALLNGIFGSRAGQ